MAEDLPLYPDFLFPVYISIIDPDVINSSHVVRLSNNDVIRSMELSIEDGPIISPYSGSAFMAAYRAAAAYYTYYEARYSGEDLLGAVTAALKRYISNDDIIIYSLWKANLLPDKLTDSQFGAIESQERIKQPKETIKKDNLDLFTYYDDLFSQIEYPLPAVAEKGKEKTPSTPPVLTDIRPITSDLVYQYSIDSAPLTIDNVQTNDVVALVTYINSVEETSLYKAYEGAGDPKALIESAAIYQTIDGLRLYYYGPEGYHVGVYNTADRSLAILGEGDLLSPLDYPAPEGYMYDFASNISGSWEVYGIGIDIDLFIHGIFVNSKMRKYFSVLETISPTFMRTKKSFNFKFYSTKDNDPDRTFELVIQNKQLLSDAEVSGTNFKSGTKYVEFSITKVDNLYQFETIKLLVSSLLSLFARELQPIYAERFTRVHRGWQPRYIVTRLFQSGEHLASKLQRLAKEIFPEGYARTCSSDRQVDVVSSEELELLREEAKARGEIFAYLEFPRPQDEPGGRIVNVVCPHSDYPYPGVKLNKLSNAAIYKWIPCCYKEDQSKAGTKLQKYLTGDTSDDKVNDHKKGTGYKPKAAQSLKYGAMGEVPDVLLRLFRGYGFKGPIERKGVSKSDDALIHCVLYAIFYIGASPHPLAARYEALSYHSERNELVADWRKTIKSGPHTEAMRQELYDYTDGEILDLVNSLNTSFDSFLFVRLLEVYFDVNIYVFEQKSDQAPTLEIPRHRGYYVRNNTDLPSIIIFKFYGKKGGRVHYELITVDSKHVVDMPEDITRLFTMYTDLYSVTSLLKQRENKISVYHNPFIFNLATYLKKVGIIPTGQLMDNYGKCRGFRVVIPRQSGNYVGTILCFPQQPVALPQVFDIISLPLPLVTEIFEGNTISAVQVVDGQLAGIWFAIDQYPEGLFVPIIYPLENGIPPGVAEGELQAQALKEYARRLIENTARRAGNPLVPTVTSGGPFSEYKHVSERLLKFLRVLSALYKAYALEQLATLGDTRAPSLESSTTDQVRQYYYNAERTRLDRLYAFTRLFKLKRGGSDADYVLYSIDVDLIEGNFEEALAYVEEASERTIVNSGLIILDSEKLMDDMKYYVRTYLVHQPKEYYTKSRVIVPEYKLFQSFQEFESWVNSLTNPPQVIFDAQEIVYSRSDPILFRSGLLVNSSLFIIQNVADGDLDRALAVASTWNREKRNSGYEADPLDSSITLYYDVVNIIGRDLAVAETIFRAGYRSRDTSSDLGKLYILSLPSPQGNRSAAVLPLY